MLWFACPRLKKQNKTKQNKQTNKQAKIPLSFRVQKYLHDFKYGKYTQCRESLICAWNGGHIPIATEVITKSPPK